MKKIFLILTLFGIFFSYSSYGQNMLKTAIITVSDAIIDSVNKDEVADNTQKRNQKIIQGKVYNLIPNYNVEKSSKEIPDCSVDVSYDCVANVINTTNKNKNAEDFYQQVAKKNRIDLFLLQLANAGYADKVIPPNYMAEFYIPLKDY